MIYDNGSEDADASALSELEALQVGRIELHEVSEEIREAFLAGFETGRASRDAEVAQLTATADRLYVAAFNPRDRAEVILRRMDWGRVWGLS